MQVLLLKHLPLSLSCVIIGIAPAIAAQPTYAQHILSTKKPTSTISHLKDFNRLAVTVREWLAQEKSYEFSILSSQLANPIQNSKLITQNSLVQVTGVKLNRVDTGLEIVLETQEGRSLQVDATKFRTEGNSLIADIPNAILALPTAQEFSAENPTTEIATVRVTQLDMNNIRVSVAGKTTPPTQEVTLITGNLSYSLSPEGEEPDEEIVVTGEGQRGYRAPNASVTKGDTPIRDLPQSVQTIPRQVLEDQQITELQDALRNVSGVVIADGPRNAFQTVSIRGFSASDNFTDGLRFRGTVSETTNLERVEVLKGSASLFFGRGTPGGTVNLVRKKPLSEPFYALEFSAGSYNVFRGAIDLSGPLTSDRKLLYRLNASVLRSASFVDFIRDDRYFTSPSITWQISEKTALNFTAEYLDSQYPNERGLPAIGTVLSNPNGKISRSRFLGEPSIDQRDEQRVRLSYELDHRFSDNWSLRHAAGIQLTYTQQNSTGPLSLRPDNRTLTRTSFFDVEQGVPRNDYVMDTYISGKFYTGSIQHKFLFGVDLTRADGENNFFERTIGTIDLFNPVYNQSPGRIVSRTNRTTINDSLGIYLRDQIFLTENLQIFLGGRFDIAKRKAINFLDTTTNSEQQDEAFSPIVGIVYKPIEPVSIYANYARSFQQIAGTTLEGSLFQPERGTQYEIGVKADLNRNLFLTLAYYDLTRSNVTTPDPRNTRFSVQTGEQRSRGVELDVVGAILPGWNIIASYAYTNTEVTQDNSIPIGNWLSNVPEHSASLWTTYELQRGPLKGWRLGVGFFFAGDRAGDLRNTFELPSYFRTDATVFYKQERFRAAVIFRNLFNIDYFEAAESNLRVFPGAPLTVQGTISWEF